MQAAEIVKEMSIPRVRDARGVVSETTTCRASTSANTKSNDEDCWFRGDPKRLGDR